MTDQRRNESDFMRFLFVKNSDGTTDFYPMFPFGKGYKLKSDAQIIKVKKIYAWLLGILFLMIGVMNLLPGHSRWMVGLVFIVLLLIWVLYPALSDFTATAESLPLKTRIQMMIIETPVLVTWLLLLVFTVPFVSLTYLILRRWHVIIYLAESRTGPLLLFAMDFLLLAASCVSGWLLYKKYKTNRDGNMN